MRGRHDAKEGGTRHLVRQQQQQKEAEEKKGMGLQKNMGGYQLTSARTKIDFGLIAMSVGPISHSL